MAHRKEPNSPRKTIISLGTSRLVYIVKKSYKNMMSSFSTRREFLKGVATLGTSLPMLAQSAWGASATDIPSPQIENEFFALAFAAATGRLSCWRKGGGKLLEGAVARANLKSGRRSTAEPAYRHSVEVVRVKDQLGAGRQIVARCADARRQLDFMLRFTL
jgi:hypothetical protein